MKTNDKSHLRINALCTETKKHYKRLPERQIDFQFRAQNDQQI